MNFNEFKTRYQKAPVEHYPHQVTAKPLVSVCVQTYQHADYIKDCLDGILMQQTDFPIEILLGEDASTDGTREICLEYAERHAEKIRLFLHHRANNISIGGQPTGRFNFYYNLYSATGKYITICEGDDFWIDPQKIQKQILFLNRNSRYGMGHTAFNVLESNEYKSYPYKHVSKPGHWPKWNDLIFENSIGTLTVIARKNLLSRFLLEMGEQCIQWPMADYAVWLFIARESKIGFLNEVTGIYRKRNGSMSAKSNYLLRKEFLKRGYDLRNYFATLHNLSTDELHRLEVEHYLRLFNLSWKFQQWENLITYYKKIKGWKKLRPKLMAKYLYGLLHNNILNES